MDLQPPAPLQKLKFFSFPLFIKRELTYSSLFLLFSIIIILNLRVPFQPLSFLPIGFFGGNYNNTQDLVLESCDYSYGTWVRDEKYWSESYGEDCEFLDIGFRCHQNGRENNDYRNWRWQPHGCDLPRFNASDLLDSSRNRRIVFVGDSIGRNQWESLVCMLAQAVSNRSTIFEENGNPITKHKGYLSIRFKNYNLTVEYYRMPFLVTVGRPPKNSPGQIRKVVKVDELHPYSKQWVGADVLVFNAGHWWNQEKTVKLGCFFEEGGFLNTTMNVKEAFHRSLQTWKSWVVQNLDPLRSYVFFRSYSPIHFSNGTWMDGGTCASYTSPETYYSKPKTEPWNNPTIYNTVQEIKDVFGNAQFLNITYLTDFRSDGHPSDHREPSKRVLAREDCSHWCLPGVPDTWNELLYAQLLSRGYKTRDKKR